jgi:hypothetical protein
MTSRTNLVRQQATQHDEKEALECGVFLMEPAGDLKTASSGTPAQEKPQHQLPNPKGQESV